MRAFWWLGAAKGTDACLVCCNLQGEFSSYKIIVAIADGSKHRLPNGFSSAHRNINDKFNPYLGRHQQPITGGANYVPIA